MGVVVVEEAKRDARVGARAMGEGSFPIFVCLREDVDVASWEDFAVRLVQSNGPIEGWHWGCIESWFGYLVMPNCFGGQRFASLKKNGDMDPFPIERYVPPTASEHRRYKVWIPPEISIFPPGQGCKLFLIDKHFYSLRSIPPIIRWRVRTSRDFSVIAQFLFFPFHIYCLAPKFVCKS